MNIGKLAEEISFEDLQKLVSYWTAHNAAQLTTERGLALLETFTRLMVIGQRNKINELKEHALNAESALCMSIHGVKSGKRLEQVRGFVDRFRNKAFNNWDWLYSEQKEG